MESLPQFLADEQVRVAAPMTVTPTPDPTPTLTLTVSPEQTRTLP